MTSSVLTGACCTPSRCATVDHIVIGPPGVIALNAKRHPGGKAWVGECMVMVNGQKTDYLRNSRFEAQRAARLLFATRGPRKAFEKPLEVGTVNDEALARRSG